MSSRHTHALLLLALALSLTSSGCSCGPDPARGNNGDEGDPDGSVGAGPADGGGGDDLDNLPPLPNPTDEEKFCLFQVNCGAREPLRSPSVVECLTALRTLKTGEIAPDFSLPVPVRVDAAIACAKTASSCQDYERCFIGAKYLDWCQTHETPARTCDGDETALDCSWGRDHLPTVITCPGGTHCDAGWCTDGTVCSAAGTTCRNNVQLVCDGPGRPATPFHCPEPYSYCNPTTGSCTSRVECSTPGFDCDGTSGLFACVLVGSVKYSRQFDCTAAGWECGHAADADRCVPTNKECEPFTYTDACDRGRITTCENGLTTRVDCRWIGLRHCSDDGRRCR